MDPTVVRSLTREYRIRTQSPELAAVLPFLDARPEMVGAELTAMDLAANVVADGIQLRLPSGDEVLGTYVQAWGRLAVSMFRAIQEEAPGAPLVHAASLISPSGERTIIVGPKGAGKSTLTLHLLGRGFAFEGDEHIVLREADLISRPRRMRVKPGSLPLVPHAADAVLNSPSLIDGKGMTVYAVDPSFTGTPWRIAPGRASRLIFLEPNHGGRSSISPLGSDETFRRLAEHCFLPATQAALASARLRKLAMETPAYELRLGDLDEARRALEF